MNPIPPDVQIMLISGGITTIVLFVAERTMRVIRRRRASQQLPKEHPRAL
jgi:hypothetical protein